MMYLGFRRGGIKEGKERLCFLRNKFLTRLEFDWRLLPVFLGKGSGDLIFLELVFCWMDDFDIDEVKEVVEVDEADEEHELTPRHTTSNKQEGFI